MNANKAPILVPPEEQDPQKKQDMSVEEFEAKSARDINRAVELSGRLAVRSAERMKGEDQYDNDSFNGEWSRTGTGTDRSLYSYSDEESRFMDKSDGRDITGMEAGTRVKTYNPEVTRYTISEVSLGSTRDDHKSQAFLKSEKHASKYNNYDYRKNKYHYKVVVQSGDGKISRMVEHEIDEDPIPRPNKIFNHGHKRKTEDKINGDTLENIQSIRDSAARILKDARKARYHAEDRASAVKKTTGDESARRRRAA